MEQSLASRMGANLKAALSKMRFSAVGGSSVGLSSSVRIDDQFIVNLDKWAGGGQNIDYSAVLRDAGQSSLVMAAVNWLGRVLPEAPLVVAKKNDEGKDNKDNDHPATQLFRRPNPYYTGSTLFKQFAFSWIIDGNVYILKVRNAGRAVTELWYVPPSMIRPRWPKDGSQFISHYEYRVDSQKYEIDPADVIHFGDGRDYDAPSYGRCGISPLKSLLREIYSDAEIANYSAALMKNGAIPPIILSLKDGTSSVKFDPQALKDSYQRATQGNQRGKAFVSSQAVDVHKVAFNPQEMDLKDLRRLPEERLAAVIGIPAIVLGFGAGLDKSTYSNTAQADESATEKYLVPLWRYIEEELGHQLLPEFDKSGQTSMKFDMHKVRALQEDEDKLYNRVTMAYEKDVIKRSEARAKLGFEFTPEDEKYKSQLGMEMAQAMAPTLDSATEEEPPAPPQQGRKALKEADATDIGILEDAVPWLLSLDEPEAAELLKAKALNGRG